MYGLRSLDGVSLSADALFSIKFTSNKITNFNYGLSIISLVEISVRPLTNDVLPNSPVFMYKVGVIDTPYSHVLITRHLEHKHGGRTKF